jgi:hypothetical protein
MAEPATQQAKLSSILGVLRRPPNGAPKSLGLTPLFDSNLERRGTLLRADARVAMSIPDEGKVILVPFKPNDEGPLQLLLTGAGGSDCCITTTNIERGTASATWGDISSNHALVVVPDGVSRVALDVGQKITAPVHNNVAVFRLPAPVESLWKYPMTWYERSGAVVRRFRTHAKVSPALKHHVRFPARIYPPPTGHPKWGQPGGCASLAGVVKPAGAKADVRAWSAALILLDDNIRNGADRAYWPRLAHSKRARLTQRNILAARPATRSPYAPLIRNNCGAGLVERSISVVIGPPHSLTKHPALDSEYWIIDRRGHWLLWWGQS